MIYFFYVNSRFLSSRKKNISFFYNTICLIVFVGKDQLSWWEKTNCILGKGPIVPSGNVRRNVCRNVRRNSAETSAETPQRLRRNLCRNRTAETKNEADSIIKNDIFFLRELTFLEYWCCCSCCFCYPCCYHGR